MSISIVTSGPFLGTGLEADYPLAVDPDSTGNMFVNLGGVMQLTGDYG